MPGWYERGAIKAALDFQDKTSKARASGPAPVAASASAPDMVISDSNPDFDEREFERYYSDFIQELKRLWGKGEAELHWVELTEDDPQRLAFKDGIPPLTLARWYRDHATPPTFPII
jgi:hypothetical protein